jgi:phage terminase large subunit
LTDLSLIAGANIKKWREHPASMVVDLWKIKPDAWQEEVLEAYPHSPRIALKACTGPGKSCVLNWIGWNFVLTRPHPIIGATSISGDNLRANLWTEFARWYDKSDLLQQMFEMTKTVIFNRQEPNTWKIEARTWPKNADTVMQGNALRGLHAEYVMWLLDETGDYPDGLLPVCEAIFSGAPKEAHIVQAGNPIKRAGPLWHASSRARKLWKLIEITADPDDPKRTPRVSVEHAKEQIEQHGRDNPYVMVNILGQFPPTDFNALISPEECEEAMRRYYREWDYREMPRVMGVDVAREGDDASVIFCRQGLQSFPMIKKRNINSLQGAGLVARKWDDWGADACFVDATGGFGAGWIDQLMVLGKAPIGIQFSGSAHQAERYYNKRTEMYFDAIDWIKRGGALPPSPEITAALTQTTYSFKGNRLLLEPKEMIKAKLGYSPDETDGFVLTFAEPVTAQKRSRAPKQNVADYDVMREANAGFNLASAIDSSYDPYNHG